MGSVELTVVTNVMSPLVLPSMYPEKKASVAGWHGVENEDETTE